MTTKLTQLIREFEGQEVEFRINETTGQYEVLLFQTAKFCGWTKLAKGKEYIRWDMVEKHLKTLGLSEVRQLKFIPEYAMYFLIGKSQSPKAEKFQIWVSKVITEIRQNGGYIDSNATEKQVDKLIRRWGSQYCTEEIHDRKSIRKYIRNYDPMKLDECINTIVEMTIPMKGDIKHELLDTAIKELKKIDKDLIKDTIKHTYIKDTANEGIITLQDVKIGKYKRRISILES